MKAQTKYYAKLTGAILIALAVMFIWEIGTPLRMPLAAVALVLLAMAFISPLGAPLYKTWNLYSRITNEGMRFFQGAGLFFIIVGLYQFRISPGGLGDLEKLLGGHLQYDSRELWIFAGAGIFIIGCISPLARVIFELWMGLAKLIQSVMSRVILTLVFVIAVIPIAIVAKLTGKKFLEKGFHREADSYWLTRDSVEFKKERYARMF